MPHARRILSSSLSLALVFACNPPNTPSGQAEASAGPAGPAGPAAPSGPVVPVVTDPVAELTALSGPAGARTDDLPEGTFLGPGAKLAAGKTLVVPRGTIAEIRLVGGTVLRLNEDTRLVLPGRPDARDLALAQGELVAIVAAGQPPLALKVGPDTLDVSTGEARALARGERRGYDVVYGSARLRTDGQDVPMGPGAHVDTPLAAPTQPVQPQVSLRPLEDTAWSRTFEIAAQMADSVPAGVGSLTARRAGSQTELYKLALTDQKVNVAISGRIARTEIEQTFYNEAGEVLEGTYRFPLPADASISGLQLLVGNTWMNAEMLEKERAREIFRQIVDATIPRDPALLEWERGNIFKLKIFPIPGRGERKIRLSYTQVLPTVGDTLRYRYPMSGASTGATGTEIENFQFTIAVDKSELPATGELVTPMAALQRRETGDKVELTTAAQRFRPVHDLGVDIPIPAADQRAHVETHLDRDGQAYFMLAFRPALDLKAVDRPRHYAFVLDRSHSTTPELWTVARSLVQATAATLQNGDRMTVLACDAACDVAPGGLAPASDAAHLAGVERFLDAQVLAGASDIGGMMRSAAEALAGADMADPRAREAERVIVYLGDGSPSAGPLAPDELLRDVERPLQNTRVEAIALGARSDLLVLGALTKKTGGDLMRADAKDDLRGLVRELRLRAALPVARDVALTLPDGMVYTHPDKVASVRPGDTITLVGKLSRPVHGPLTLRATGPDGQVVQDSLQVDLEAVPGPSASRRAHLPRTWAREEIEALTATRGHSARAEIIDLSRQYTVLSRYTALLVLENDAMYREFNVVRQSGRTTGWNGQLGGGQPTGAAPVATATPIPADKNEDAAAAQLRPAPAPAEAPRPEPTTPAADRKTDSLADTKDAERSRDEDDDSVTEPRGKGRASREQQGPAESEAAEEDASIDLDPGSASDTKAEKAKSSDAPRPAPTSAPAKKSIDRASSSGGIALDDYGDIGYGGGYGKPGKGYRAPANIWKIAQAGAPDAAALAKLDALRRATLADPTSRAAHRKLVQAAIRAGAPDAFEYARAWAEADPDHAPALLAVADLLAARSDANAPRAYGSAAEVKPFDKQLQANLADAYENKGDWGRACAHRRALVSIDPARAAFRVDLARCLSGQGKTDMARETLHAATARGQEIARALRDLDAGALRPLAPTLPGGAELRATLSYSGAGDLDIAIVDPRGRRLSALRPDGIKVVEAVGGETLTVGSVRKTLAVEVSRIAGQGTISGTLTLRTPTVTRSYPFTLDQGSLRLATVSFTRSYGYPYSPYIDY